MTKRSKLLLAAGAIAVAHMVGVTTVAAQPAAALSAADKQAAFKAAGFKQAGKKWRRCDDTDRRFAGGEVERVLDLNGDGRPEAVLIESSSYCFGNTGTGFSLVSQAADGRWRLLLQSPGIPTFLSSRGADGFPDVEIGGPGFCFPVARWNGRDYALHRHQYEGKRCTPN